MKTIYLDSDFKCHVSNNEEDTMIIVETDCFDDKCDAFIEGYRFVPKDKTWTRPDGIAFTGEMIIPWKDYAELDAAQRIYEQELLAECKEALRTVGIEIK